MRQPRFIELDDAVSRIKQACDKPSKDSSPFFFMVGAGISYPSVPLATDIVNDCQKVAETYGRTAKAPDTSGVEMYSHWFQTAYAEPYQRQEYLQKLIEGKPITHANFRLAHLLLHDTISNVVITTNFDDFLSKALGLFGKSHIVCDHPQTVGRINHNQPMLQIVHLHGSYWFYDCCNLRGELEDRAEHSTQTTLTMASLLGNVLWDRSPLVIGYSGWEGDVFTEALKRRLAQPLRSNAYWFCYKQSEVDSFPDWLKGNPNIFFVVQKKKPAGKADISSGVVGPATASDQPGIQGVKSTGISGEKDEPVLPADTVLDRLIQAFSLTPPELTTDPLGFFARHLDNSLPKDAASNMDNDIYAIKRVIERVTRARQRDDEENGRPATGPSESQLDLVRDALRTAEYGKAVTHGSQIDFGSLSPSELDELADAMWSAAERLKDHPDENLAAYDLVVAIREHESKKVKPNLARRLQLANSLLGKGFLLHTIRREEEAIAVNDELIRRYGEARELPIQQSVAKGFYNKTLGLGNLNRNEEAIADCDELINRYGKLTDPVIQEQVAKALLNKGVILGNLSRSEEEMAVYEEVLRRYGGASDEPLREHVASALFYKAITLHSLDRKEEAIAAYNEVVRRYREATSPALRLRVAQAWTHESVLLGELQRYGEASSVSAEVVRRYGETTDPAMRKQVMHALNSHGFHLLLAAKGLFLNGDKEAAQDGWRRALASLETALERNPSEPIILGNQAYLEFLLGNKNRALELLTKAIELGGEPIRTAELKDAEINRLPQDDEFCEMVRAIPSAYDT
jgi:tetratricopeptide (TPR) repeat protein/NAD-dependent SIR2 family protein deacetylase